VGWVPKKPADPLPFDLSREGAPQASPPAGSAADTHTASSLFSTVPNDARLWDWPLLTPRGGTLRGGDKLSLLTIFPHSAAHLVHDAVHCWPLAACSLASACPCTHISSRWEPIHMEG
jgi:hypothetical protein